MSAKYDFPVQITNMHCAYCKRRTFRASGARGLMATIDHIQPLLRGGKNERTNRTRACHRCNVAKSDMTGEEFREFMSTGVIPRSYLIFLAAKGKCPQSPEKMAMRLMKSLTIKARTETMVCAS